MTSLAFLVDKTASRMLLISFMVMPKNVFKQIVTAALLTPLDNTS
jgi:hypothetical protein